MLYFVAADIKSRQVGKFVEFIGEVFDEVVGDVEGSEFFELKYSIVD